MEEGFSRAWFLHLNSTCRDKYACASPALAVILRLVELLVAFLVYMFTKELYYSLLRGNIKGRRNVNCTFVSFLSEPITLTFMMGIICKLATVRLLFANSFK
jgi:hypothetical protein